MKEAAFACVIFAFTIIRFFAVRHFRNQIWPVVRDHMTPKRGWHPTGEPWREALMMYVVLRGEDRVFVAMRRLEWGMVATAIAFVAFVFFP